MKGIIPQNSKTLLLEDFPFSRINTPQIYTSNSQLIIFNFIFPQTPHPQNWSNLNYFTIKRAEFSQKDQTESKKLCQKHMQQNQYEYFRSGQQCSSDCSCTNCINCHRNNLKVRKEKIQGGCNCKKTHCLKKYYECHSRELHAHLHAIASAVKMEILMGQKQKRKIFLQ